MTTTQTVTVTTAEAVAVEMALEAAIRVDIDRRADLATWRDDATAAHDRGLYTACIESVDGRIATMTAALDKFKAAPVNSAALSTMLDAGQDEATRPPCGPECCTCPPGSRVHDPACPATYDPATLTPNRCPDPATCPAARNAAIRSENIARARRQGVGSALTNGR